VIAVDLSAGVEKGEAFRHMHPGARPEHVHFVQADLQSPPLALSSVDIIHSAGVLHHTPDTYYTFQQLTPLLREAGTFYIWLYKYEPLVTPVVNGIRALTTRVPPDMFAHIASAGAEPFRLLCRLMNSVGIRSYPRVSHREAALALMDIFGAPYAHYHSFPEVTRWFQSDGFDEVWECNDDRRGFGACGRRSPSGGDLGPLIAEPTGSRA
jgi:SAM-dependent methyltransferase